MAFIPAVHCAIASVQGTVNGRQVSFGLNCRYTPGAYAQENIDDLAAAVDGWVQASWLSRISAEATYDNTHVRGLTSEADLEADNADGAGVGLLAGETLPNNVTFALKHTTGFTGRTARGRTYVWGMAALALDANEDMVSVEYADYYIEKLEELPAALLAVDWEHVVVSRYFNKVARVTATIRPVVGYAYTDRRVDTRRKRMG